MHFSKQVSEVGPFIYYFGQEKINIKFNDFRGTVKYKSRRLTEYDPIATKNECPSCKENDMVISISFS